MAKTCEVDLPDAWLRLMSADTSSSWSSDRMVQLITDDGSTAALVEDPSSPRLEWQPSGDGEPVTVAVFDNEPEAQAMGLDFDGRYLVYSVTWSYEIFTSPWTIYAWDTIERGDPVKLADSPTENYPDGSAGSMPLIEVLAFKGTAAWVARDPTNEDPYSRSLFTHDLTSGVTTVRARGGFGSAERIANTAIVSELSMHSPDGTWHTFALNDQPPIQLPEEFLQSRAASNPSASSRGMAWKEGTFTEDGTEDGARVWFWPLGAEESILLLDGESPTGETLDWTDAVDVNDRFLTLRLMTTSDVYTYALDLDAMTWTTPSRDILSSELTARPGVLEISYNIYNDGVGTGIQILTPNDDLPPLPTCAT